MRCPFAFLSVVLVALVACSSPEASRGSSGRAEALSTSQSPLEALATTSQSSPPVWVESQRLTASDGAERDFFGRTISVSGDTVLVGAFGDDVSTSVDQGSVYVFVKSGTSWSLQQKLAPSDGAAGDAFGISVSLSGDTALIGSYQDDIGSASNRGSAYVFVRSGTTWTQQQKLTASDGVAEDWFGAQVSLSGDTAIATAIGDDSSRGSAYVFVRSGTTWTQTQKLTASDGTTFDGFGFDVFVSGDTALIGAMDEDVGQNPDQGAVYVFVNGGSGFIERQKFTGRDTSAHAYFGISAGLSGETAVVGAYFDDVGSTPDQGSAYVFRIGDANGTSCTQSGDCASGRCVQNVCCDDDCTGACESCLAAHTGGTDGTCAPVTGGTDPKNLCDDQGAASCGTTGVCGASGSCAYYSTATPCGSPTCSGSLLKDQFCDGSGMCVPESGGDDCAPFTCSSGACDDPCGGDDECVAGHFCSSGSCVPKGGKGAPCDDDDECTDGQCVDDVCCESACDGACEACSTLAKGAGDDGECEAVVLGGDPDDDCAAEAPETCGRTGACDGSGACQLHAAGVSCGMSTCDTSTAKGQICDGDGMCVTSMTGVDCAPYACASGACRNPCSAPSDCLTGYVCVSGTCRQPGSSGTPCEDGSQCSTGLCVDGVCCDDACGGTCVACSAAKKGQGADGECGPIRAAQDPDSECAAEDESSCGQNGQCNGAGACARWAAGTECAPGTCSGTTQTATSTCDDDGECVSGTRTECVRGYRCDGRSCATGCDDDTQCATGYVCDMARDTCVSEPDGGAGAGGEAGSPATGGAAGGAIGGTGGSAGEAGAASGEAGEGGEATTSKPKPANSSDDGGCGCRTAGRTSQSYAWLLAFGVIALVRARAKQGRQARRGKRG